jgi:hypothetical protein
MATFENHPIDATVVIALHEFGHNIFPISVGSYITDRKHNRNWPPDVMTEPYYFEAMNELRRRGGEEEIARPPTFSSSDLRRIQGALNRRTW